MTDQKTIQEMIWDCINAIQKNQSDQDPATLAQQVIQLSTLYANLTKQIADFEHAYQTRLGDLMDLSPTEPFNKIELAAKRFDEYHKLKTATALEKSCVQIIRAVNKYIKIRQNEEEVSKYI